MGWQLIKKTLVSTTQVVTKEYKNLSQLYHLDSQCGTCVKFIILLQRNFIF